jgi:TRAP-type mannitol/chloroaromatic compound transport system permease small subunit
MHLLLRIHRAIDGLSLRIGRAASWLTLAMVLLASANTVLRYLGRHAGQNLTSNALLEGQWYLFSALFLLAAAPTLQRDAHVRVDVLYGRLSPRAKAAVDLAGGVLFLLPFCAFALWVSWPTVVSSVQIWEGSPDPGGLPRWPVKSLLLVGFGLLGLQGVSQVLKHGLQLAGQLPLPGEE